MRVAVFGAGYAGLTLARRLERELPEFVDLVVVDDTATHLVQHELHRIVRRPGLADVITVPLADVLSRAEIRRARVADVDVDRRIATLEAVDGTSEDPDENCETPDHDRFEYDVGAICLGAETAYYDVPGAETFGLPLKRLSHARAIRNAALDAVEGRAVVVGAGLSGVQLAGELAALSDDADLDLEVTVVEALDRVAPTFDEAFGAAIEAELVGRGVRIETGAAVDRVDADVVTLSNGRELPYDALAWTGGIRGPDALGGERLPAAETLEVADGTFVLGDAGAVVDDRGRPAPASAQTAIAQAEIAAENVLRRIGAEIDDGQGFDARSRGDADGSLRSYRYESPGWIVSVGDGAVAQIGPVVLSGEGARTLKALVGAGHLGAIADVARTSDLVAAELGWPTTRTARRLVDLSQMTTAPQAAVRTGLGTPIGSAAFELADALVPVGGVDLTAATRLADRTYPGSPAHLVERTVAAPLEALFGSRESRGSTEAPTDTDEGDERESDGFD